MATVTKTFTFGSNAEGWAVSGGTADTTLGWASTGGNTGGCLSSRLFGRNKSADPHWYYAGTWEDMGVPAGATVTHIRLIGFDWRCSEWNVGNTTTQVRLSYLYDSAGTTLINELSTNAPTVSGTTSYATISGTVQAVGSAYQASNTSVQLWWDIYLRTANNASAAVTLLMDNFSIEITYTTPGTAYTETVDDSVTASDNNARVTHFVKTQADTATSSDENVHLKTFQRTVAESVTASETPTPVEAYVRSLADTATSSDDNTRLSGVGHSQSLSDTATASDSSTRERGIIRSLSDSVTASENNTDVSAFQRTNADSVTASDANTKILALQRSLADSVTAAESQVSVKTMSKSLSDSVTASESTSIFSSNSMSGKIILLAQRIGQECKAIWTALGGKSDTSHDHSGVYEPVISKSAGYLTYTGSTWLFKNETYSLSTHNHDGTYQSLDADLTAIASLGFSATSFLKKTAVNTWQLDTNTYLTANQSITISGDGSGSGTVSIALTVTGIRGASIPTLATGYLRYTGSSWQFLNETYLTAITKVMVEAVLTGAITSHTHAYIPTTHTVNAIVNGTGFLKNNGSGTWSWDNSTYLTAITKAMVEAVLTGTITSHDHSGVYQPLDADLTSIAALGFTATAFLKKTAANTWALDTNTYLTTNQTITLSGDVSGSGTTSITVTVNNIKNKAIPTLATGYLRYDGTNWQFLNETYSLSSHNHSGTYEVPLTFSTGLNRATNTITVVFGTTGTTACVGNDSRLSDTRTPTDNSVTTTKLAASYKTIVAMAALNVD